MCNGAQDLCVKSCCGEGECRDGRGQNRTKNIQKQQKKIKHTQQTDPNIVALHNMHIKKKKKNYFSTVIIYTTLKFSVN